MSKRKPSMASQLIGLGGQHVDHNALRERLADRDRRQASDDRTEAQR